MANYNSSYTGAQVDNAVKQFTANTADSGKVLTANGSGATEWVYPNATNINSGSATSGQVLTANGSGGASWITSGALYSTTLQVYGTTSATDPVFRGMLTILTTNQINATGSSITTASGVISALLNINESARVPIFGTIRIYGETNIINRGNKYNNTLILYGLGLTSFNSNGTDITTVLSSVTISSISLSASVSV